MSGLYIHIPFCRQACHYCDFHFSTTLKSKSDLVNAICRELEIRSNEQDGLLHTIYLGGGTPSLLTAEELNKIFDVIAKNYTVAGDAEITLEGNPDDLSKEYLKQLQATPVNRLSIGIQSFRNEDLEFMNRAHTAEEALQSVLNAAEAGYTNLTIDLIYGIPGQTVADWEKNLQTALSLPVNHLSAYCLTVEEGTALAYKVKKGTAKAVNDELAAEHFRQLLFHASEAGIPWYEISNFARAGYESRHNSAYWSGEKYLGIGPSAHSFDGFTRSWNISNNQAYIKGIAEGNPIRESEELTISQRVNEKILTALRTRKGLTLMDIRTIDPSAIFSIMESAQPHLAKGTLQLHNDRLSLSEEGLLFADAIAADLFL
jgi:oxygen-independent coproporphyrinogen-3 oxidase